MLVELGPEGYIGFRPGHHPGKFLVVIPSPVLVRPDVEECISLEPSGGFQATDPMRETHPIFCLHPHTDPVPDTHEKFTTHSWCSEDIGNGFWQIDLIQYPDATWGAGFTYVENPESEDDVTSDKFAIWVDLADYEPHAHTNPTGDLPKIPKSYLVN